MYLKKKEWKVTIFGQVMQSSCKYVIICDVTKQKKYIFLLPQEFFLYVFTKHTFILISSKLQ